MNWDQIEGQWRQVTGQVKSRWGKLTDDDVTYVAGKKLMLIGKLQERYGVLKDDAEKQVDDWLAKLTLGDSAKKDLSTKAHGKS